MIVHIKEIKDIFKGLILTLSIQEIEEDWISKRVSNYDYKVIKEREKTFKTLSRY